jgi:hypothetical protein
MAYDGAVSAIKHGVVFSTVGIVLTNLIVSILLPFIAYSIIKTAAVAARKTIFTAMSICKSTTTTLVNFQVKTCKTTVQLVSKLTKTSLDMTRLLMKQMISTMRRLAGFGKQYCNLCLDTVLKFKDLTISFVKFGLKTITTSVRLTITTVKKLAELVLAMLTEVPQQLFNLVKVLFGKVFPGMVKIMIYFPQEYFRFMNSFLPAYINFVFNLCKTAVEFDMTATSLVVLFHLIAVGVKFVGKFFKIGKQFVGDFVSGIDGILDVIPAFGEILDSDTVASIPDKLIAFIIYDLKFKTGMNELFNATKTTLPQIEAKKKVVANAATVLSGYQTERSALIKQIEILPDPEKSLRISQLGLIIGGLERDLETQQRQLFQLELNQVYTFDELILRMLFWNISLSFIYTTPPPILAICKIMMDLLFYTNITPSFTEDLGFKETVGYSDIVEVSIDVTASFTVRPVRIADFIPGIAESLTSFVDWLEGRLKSEDAYEKIDGKNKSKLRAVTRNPAAFVKFTTTIILKWLTFVLSDLSINIVDFIDVSFSFSTDFSVFGVTPPGFDSPSTDDILDAILGTTDIVRYLTTKAVNFILKTYSTVLVFLVTLISDYLKDVIFAGLDAAYPSDNFDWL